MQTKLEAINYILSQVGASPVSNLSNLRPDLASALLRLDEADLWVQKPGWWFNKLLEVNLVPEEDKTISLPINTLKIASNYPTFVIAQYVDDPTKQQVFDPLTNTYEFSDFIVADITLRMAWEHMPMAAQDAIMYRAAATMVQHDLEDMNKSNGIMAEFKEAYLLLKTEDLEIKQRHTYSTPAVRRMMNHVNPYKRRRGARNPMWPGGQQIG